MKVEQLIVGPLETNCYIVFDEISREGIVIDPGGDHERIISLIQKLGLSIKCILNTHGHIDHIASNAQVKKATGAVTGIHENDSQLLIDGSQNGADLFGISYEPDAPDFFLTEGLSIEAGQLKLDVLHVPGHSPGSVAFHTNKKIFCGDLIFSGSVGRTDLPGGNWRQLCESIKAKILTMEEDTQLLPGHGPSTTVQQEKSKNPFVSEILRQ